MLAGEDGLREGGVSTGGGEGRGRTWSRRRESRLVKRREAVLGDGCWRTAGGQRGRAGAGGLTVAADEAGEVGGVGLVRVADVAVGRSAAGGAGRGTHLERMSVAWAASASRRRVSSRAPGTIAPMRPSSMVRGDPVTCRSRPPPPWSRPVRSHTRHVSSSTPPGRRARRPPTASPRV